jgi:hypothetical protein
MNHGDLSYYLKLAAVTYSLARFQRTGEECRKFCADSAGVSDLSKETFALENCYGLDVLLFVVTISEKHCCPLPDAPSFDLTWCSNSKIPFVLVKRCLIEAVN